MFVLMSLPYNARYHKHEGTHLWFFYKQLDSLAARIDDVTFMGWENNYIFPDKLADDVWEKNSSVREKLEYNIPSNELLSRTKIISVDQSIFAPLEEKLKSNNLVWRYLIKHEYEPLKEFIREKLEEIQKKSHIEAIIIYCNSPSVKSIGREMGIPVIHTEIGPTRKPQYLQTAYWDLSGVNGNTEAAQRFSMAKDELKNAGLTKRELLYLFSSEEDFKKNDSFQDTPEYPVGVAGQVDDDSNIIAYSNGFNNLELLKYADFHFGQKNVLFRNHPGAQTYFTSNLDRSPSPALFFKRIEKLITINSSMALEASLLGKPVTVLGDSPFKLLSDDIINNSIAADGHIEELNFLCLNYIIPYSMIFDYDYCMWRLTFPSETEIRNRHLNFYLKQKGFSNLEDFRKNIPEIPSGRKALPHTRVLEISAGNIPYRLENECNLTEYVSQCRSEIAELTKKLDEEISHYSMCLDNARKELEILNQAYEYNRQDAENYRQAYEYNESEAKRLAALVAVETENRQNLQQEISSLRSQRDSLQKQLEEISAELAGYKAQITDLETGKLQSVIKIAQRINHAVKRLLKKISMR